MRLYVRLAPRWFCTRKGHGPSDQKEAVTQKGNTVQLYQHTARPETLFGHMYGESEGYLVTFTGQQARLTRPGAPANELTATRQRSWSYPAESAAAADYLVDEAQEERDAYFGVHLFREEGNRLASNALPTVRCLWLDEDEGHYSETGPEPTAIVHSSRERRHLYWRLTQPVAVEWAVAMNRRIATWAGGDIGKAGAASVLRSTGTANFKRHPHVDLVVGEFTDVEDWEPEIMDQAIPEIPDRGHPRSEADTTGPYDGPELELAEFLEGVEILGEVADGLGRKLAIVCPWVHEHSGGDRSGTRIGQRAGGGLWFHCDHAHCQGRTWRDFKRVVRRTRTFTIHPPGAARPLMKVEVRHGR
jgi:RepB DNA-primase from phage plasmid